jgi:hypothetical protein
MTPGGQPMPHQMQQMGHPGVSGPGQPHVTQAGAMMGMQPGGMGGQPPGSGMVGAQMGGMPGQMGGQSMAGGMPNAQAINHMNPQAHMQQQQMMQQQREYTLEESCLRYIGLGAAGVASIPNNYRSQLTLIETLTNGHLM